MPRRASISRSVPPGGVEELARNTDRIWHFDEGHRASSGRVPKEYRMRKEADQAGGVLIDGPGRRNCRLYVLFGSSVSLYILYPRYP